MEKTQDEVFDDIMIMIGNLETKLKKKVAEREYSPPINEKKNSQLHILIETSLINKVEKDAKERGISMAEFVRSKLKGNNQLDRIELKIDKLLSSKKISKCHNG